jgi:peptidoglycan/LPS O-acetylase OafA/YrhL
MAASDSREQAQTRLPGLDYLRGLAALSIMIYHYSSWIFGEQEAGSLLGRLGIYGVAIFYILSGQTLSYIYSSKLRLNTSDLGSFYKKRFFRIFPLLWLATGISILLSKHIPNIFDVLLNITGLFGLIRWDIYFATGAWSIGNELCFYLIFPLIIFLLNNYRFGFSLVTLAVVSIYIFFAFKIIQPTIPLSAQWHNYTNPLNQFLFFLGGAVIGKTVKPNTIKTGTSFIIGLIGSIAFVLIPVNGNAVILVTGINRLLFIASCLLICYSFFKTMHAPTIIDRPLMLLGQISYSLYLLHPLVYNIVKAVFSISAKVIKIPTLYLLPVSVAVSLVASYISYQYFERFFIRISHRTQPIISSH